MRKKKVMNVKMLIVGKTMTMTLVKMMMESASQNWCTSLHWMMSPQFCALRKHVVTKTQQRILRDS